MSVGGTMPAGSGRALRLDPFRLPVRFAAADGGADEQTRFVELHPSRVVLRRAVRGMRMALNLPINSYLGVALRMVAPQPDQAGGIAVTLVHRDPALSVPLLVAQDGEDVIAEWQAWARVLMLPLLVTEADGSVREPFPRLGALRVAKPVRRRRRQTAIKARRPALPLRRRGCRAHATPILHQGEREIIARN